MPISLFIYLFYFFRTATGYFVGYETAQKIWEEQLLLESNTGEGKLFFLQVKMNIIRQKREADKSLSSDEATWTSLS